MLIDWVFASLFILVLVGFVWLYVKHESPTEPPTFNFDIKVYVSPENVVSSQDQQTTENPGNKKKVKEIPIGPSPGSSKKDDWLNIEPKDSNI